MGGHDLRHLAVITGTAAEHPEDIRRAVIASCDKAAEIAREAFAVVPGLRAFSWLDPGLDSLLSRATASAAARVCAEGAQALAAVTADLGISLRLCGRVDDLPGAALGQAAGAQDERTLLWFQRYSGRDEIVRSAGRFLAAHPGLKLADDDLDAWLDTAGIPDPDLLLYVGGALEPRDVLLWQGSYAEISHTAQTLTSFSSEGLRRAVSDFFARQRRFGR
jgi:undecaprenyl diphosphate synthase